MGQHGFNAFTLMHGEKERETVITHFSAVYIFDSRFSKEEVDEITMGEGMHKMRSCKKKKTICQCRTKLRYCSYSFDTSIYYKSLFIYMYTYASVCVFVHIYIQDVTDLLDKCYDLY